MRDVNMLKIEIFSSLGVFVERRENMKPVGDRRTFDDDTMFERRCKPKFRYLF